MSRYQAAICDGVRSGDSLGSKLRLYSDMVSNGACYGYARLERSTTYNQVCNALEQAV